MSSSITGFIAEAWPEHSADLPGFGGFLCAGSQELSLKIYGVVFNVVTGPQDTQHKPVPLKMTRQQLKLEQPHIFALLKTELHVIICGHKRGKRVEVGLPPHPPFIHDFVYPLDSDELEQIGDSADFLPLLARVGGVPQDELISACLKNMAVSRDNSYDFLVQAGKQLAQIYRNDYDTLTAILRKIRP